MLELIPEGGNFTDIPKDHPLYVKGMISHVYRRMHRNEPSKQLLQQVAVVLGAITSLNRVLLLIENEQGFKVFLMILSLSDQQLKYVARLVMLFLLRAWLNWQKHFTDFSDNYEKVDLHEKLVEEKEILFHDRLSKIRGENNEYSFSNIANAKITEKSLNAVWMDLFKSADEVLMATGYVSNDAVVELHKILELNDHIQK